VTSWWCCRRERDRRRQTETGDRKFAGRARGGREGRGSRRRPGFANARSLSSEDVLDELRLPLSARDLATLSERLNGVEFEIRKPNLEDLFLRLSEKKGPTS